MDTGSFQLRAFEAEYEQLVSEALRQGTISDEERDRLNQAARTLGLDPDRAARLEEALRAANVVSSRRGPRDTLVDEEAPFSFTDSNAHLAVAVESWGRARAVSITFEPLDTAESEVEVDTLRLPKKAERARSELELLHQRYDTAERNGNKDAQWCTAAVLAHRGAATANETAFYQAYRRDSPPRPQRALSVDAWSLLFHPNEDLLTGEIFAVIAPAALLGRVAAMRADRSLVALDLKERHDPAKSTVSAVRAIAWAAAALGLQPPPVFVSPDVDAGFEIVVQLPPASRVGSRALAGQSTRNLAFQAARHVTWFRADHFACTLVPTFADLSDLFVAALALGAPELELHDDARERAMLIARALAPVLEPAQLRRLRELVARFIAKGGRTDLMGWARAAGFTGGRAGLLLAGDLEVACAAAMDEPNGPDRVRDLEQFFASDGANDLRRTLGIAVTR